MRSIVVFYASEGTGHRTAAENLRDWFLLENPGSAAACFDVLDYVPSWLRYLVSNGYLLMARHAPWAWGHFYWGSDKPSLMAAIFDRLHSFLCRIYLPRIEREAYEYRAEAVLFTHYFGANHFAKRNIDNIPVFYVNTDFVCHRFQRDKVYKASFVASPAAVSQHADEGIGNVFDFGIPVSPKFSALPSKEAARENTGLDISRKTILVSGGGIGAGSVLTAVASLVHRTDWQIAVICGNNKNLYKKLLKYNQNSRVHIEGFVSNMEDYYRAADLAVMKPGGLSLSEALAAGLPLILMDPIPGQEQLNMDYLVDLGAAIALKDANTACAEAEALLADTEKLEAMAAAIKKISRPFAASKILEKIKNYTAG